MKNLSCFKKSECTKMQGSPTPVCVCSLFNDLLAPPLNERIFWMSPCSAEMIKLYESCNCIICIYTLYIPYIYHIPYHIYIWYGTYIWYNILYMYIYYTVTTFINICIYMYILRYYIYLSMLFLVFLLIFLKNIKFLAGWIPWRGHDALVNFFLQFGVCLVSWCNLENDYFT